MGLDWGGEVYGGERSEETKNHLKSLCTVYEGAQSWTSICLTLLGTASHHPPGLLNQKPSRKSDCQRAISSSLSPFTPVQSRKTKPSAKHFPSPVFLFQNGINNTLPFYNHHQPLMPTSRRKNCLYIYILYLNVQINLFFSLIFLSSCTYGYDFRNKGCVAGWSTPRVLGRGNMYGYIYEIKMNRCEKVSRK